MTTSFVHLHAHSHYSLLNALPKVKELIAAAVADNMTALALTDNGNLYGAIQFYKECKKANIKPIIGLDAYVAARGRTDKEAGIDNRRFRVVLLAENNEGYKNLMALSTRSFLEGFYYKPRVDRALLREHAAGLIAIIPSFSGEVAAALRNKDTEKANAVLADYRSIFGDANVFIEITHHPEIAGHEALQQELVALAAEAGVEIVAAHDVYYITQGDRKAREILTKIQSHSDGGDAIDMSEERDFSFITQKVAEKNFKKLPQALANTLKIAERCTIEIELGAAHFPYYPIPEGTTAEKELQKLVEQGFALRNLEKTPELEKQVSYELEIINQKGYAPYFLVVADLLRFAREKNIYSNIRGSVTGSVVTYLIGITNLNPFEYGLRFERFLNPERPSLPDIDMDFADNRRDEVIQYARDKYGEDKVAQIGTFGTMMARAAVRDVARALGEPYGTGDMIAKLIPFGSQGFPMTIDRALSMVPELKDLYKKNETVKEIIDTAKKIEGCARHISVHAAGVVIAPSKLTDFTPVQLDPKGGKLITQYDMHAVEDAGLPKFDFLGLKNLAILADAVARIKKLRNIDLDIESIPLDDEKTFAMLSRGETMGLFQLNGSGMTRFLKELQPTTIHDINAMVALYRPGPMEFIPEYIKRKHNPGLVDYPHELLREDLQNSFGLLIYQEDVMMTAIKLARYTWLEADQFRKAMGKKIPELMAQQEEKFKSGCVENGIAQELANDLWERIIPFAAYAFNKAHSASYGHVAYQTSYLKANFPVEYMAALMTADAGDVEKVAEAISECKRMGIAVLPPDVNESYGDFAVVRGDEKFSVRNEIRFGLHSIKNFGEGIADTIIEERKQHGRFSSLADFLKRVQSKNLNRKSLESLIQCGALDAMGERGVLLANIETLLAYHRESSAMANQVSLFGSLPESSSPLTLQSAAPAAQMQRLVWEKELLGLYISGHPLDRHREKLIRYGKTINQVKAELQDGMIAVVAGIVEEMKPVLTKSGEKMAFVRLADFSGSIEAVIFPRLLTSNQETIVPEACIAIKGRMSNRNGTQSIVAEAVKTL